MAIRLIVRKLRSRRVIGPLNFIFGIELIHLTAVLNICLCSRGFYRTIATGKEPALGTISKLFVAPASLASCMFAVIYRDTRGADLSAHDRTNYFPASPLVSVTKVLSGALHIETNEGPRKAAPLFAMGPQQSPTVSWSPDAVTALTVGFYHDAWIKLGGNERYDSVPEHITGALSAFAEELNPESAWDLFCARLVKPWAAQRSEAQGGHSGISDWVQYALAKAALSGPGQSLRSVERRLKRSSGQSKRALEFYTSVEHLHRVALENSGASLAEIAYDAGFADQSHMGRVLRRATGFSPARLNHAIKTEEPFWCYRLLGERF